MCAARSEPPARAASAGLTRRRLLWLVWALWAVWLLWATTAARYWINNDTIGALDSARLWRRGAWPDALNAYWGNGYSLLLSLLPLHDLTSFWFVHGLAAACVLAAQAALVAALRRSGVEPGRATGLALVWGASGFATGGALFVTADPALWLLSALALWLWTRPPTPVAPARAAALGALHALAGLTKSVALPGWLPLPLLLLARGNGRGDGRGPYARIASGLAYAAPVVALAGLWAWGSQARYGRLALLDTGAYNYINYVVPDDAFAQAVWRARHNLPLWGTYWWSDVSTALIDWNGRGVPDEPLPWREAAARQAAALQRNLAKWVAPRDLATGGVSLALWVGAMAAGMGGVGRGARVRGLLWVAGALTALHLLSNWTARFWPLVTIWGLPVVGLWLQTQRRGAAALLLVIGLGWGLAATGYALWRHAPNAAQFAIAEALRTADAPGPLGGYRASAEMMDHHAVVGWLTERPTAELLPLTAERTLFAATFRPGAVLLALGPEEDAPSALRVRMLALREGEPTVVDEYEFAAAAVALWRSDASVRLALYLP